MNCETTYKTLMSYPARKPLSVLFEPWILRQLQCLDYLKIEFEEDHMIKFRPSWSVIRS